MDDCLHTHKSKRRNKFYSGLQSNDRRKRNGGKLKYNVLRLSYRKKILLCDMYYSKMCQDGQKEAIKMDRSCENGQLLNAREKFILCIATHFLPHINSNIKSILPWLTHLQTISLQLGQQSLLKQPPS